LPSEDQKNWTRSAEPHAISRGRSCSEGNDAIWAQPFHSIAECPTYGPCRNSIELPRRISQLMMRAGRSIRARTILRMTFPVFRFLVISNSTRSVSCLTAFRTVINYGEWKANLEALRLFRASPAVLRESGGSQRWQQ
jgi:hypothetical protein